MFVRNLMFFSSVMHLCGEHDIVRQSVQFNKIIFQHLSVCGDRQSSTITQ